MSSIYKRGEYQWEARVRKRGFPSQARTFESRAEAQAWSIQVEADMLRGSFLPRNEAERTTMFELISRFELEVSPTHRGHIKEAARLHHLSKHKVWQTYVANLKPADIAIWRDERLKQVSPATVLREMGDLSLIVNHSMKEWGIYLPSNPFALVKRPKVNNARNRRLGTITSSTASLCEEQLLLNACKPGLGTANACRVPWLLPFVKLAIETAMRRGEILSLEWKNIRLDTGVIFLPHTKNGTERHVPLTPEAVQILKGIPRSQSARVFDITENAFKLAWKRAIKRAGLSDLHFHDLRHEATSRLATKLDNVLELSSVTGHIDLRMLKRYYHPRAEDIAQKLARK